MVSARRAGFAVPWVVVGLLGFSGVAPVGRATAIPSVPAVGMPPAHGIFSGFTSQSGNGNQISFRLSGSSLRGETVLWQARCRSGRSLLSATIQPKVRVTAGTWSDNGGKYVGRLLRGAYPVSGAVIGHFRVLTNTGRFDSVISATGVERLTATLYDMAAGSIPARPVGSNGPRGIRRPQAARRR